MGRDVLVINTNKINKIFNTRFKKQRKDFRYAEGKYKFYEHVLKGGQETKTIEATMTIIHHENNHRKINTLEEIEILKAACSMMLSQDKTAQCTNFSSQSVISTPTINSPGQATK